MPEKKKKNIISRPEKPSFQVFCSFQWFVAQFGAIPQVSRSLKSTGSCANLDAGWVAQCPQPTHGEFRCWKCRVESLNVSWILKLMGSTSARHDYHDRSWLLEAFRCPKHRSQVLPAQSPWGDAEESGKPSFHKSVSLPFESKAGEDSIDTEARQGRLVVSRNACDGEDAAGLHSGGWGWRRCWGPREAGGWGSVSDMNDMKGETSYHEELNNYIE